MYGTICRRLVPVTAALLAIAGLTGEACAAGPAGPIDGDLAKPAIAIPASIQPAPPPSPDAAPTPAASPAQAAGADFAPSGLAARAPDQSVEGEIAAAQTRPADAVPAGEDTATWNKDELMGAAEGVFGKGAVGLAEMIEDLLRKQGKPNGYIAGREGGGALFFGLRYGSGTLHHKVEGRRPVYWTGPSLGLDLGGNAAKTFVLVYNLYDTEELYSRFGASEGQAYLIAGFHVSYLRQGDKVLIPVRSGAGLRLGVNAGYMKFSHSQKILPF